MCHKIVWFPECINFWLSVKQFRPHCNSHSWKRIAFSTGKSLYEEIDTSKDWSIFFNLQIDQVSMILFLGLSRERVTLEDIDSVVITHGHPGHMGNMNFFGQKPVLFHTMEYMGKKVAPTELRNVSSNFANQWNIQKCRNPWKSSSAPIEKFRQMLNYGKRPVTRSRTSVYWFTRCDLLGLSSLLHFPLIFKDS